MRKIILLLMFIMMLGLTSATITVYINETRPTFNLELVEDDGTELLNDNTNFYFQCYLGGFRARGSAVSPASEEFNITTNSTHRWINISNIQDMCGSYTMYNLYKGVICRVSENRSFLDWGGEGYMPWAFDNNETGAGHYGWTAKYSPGTYWDAGFRCSNGLDSVIVKDHTADCGTICTTDSKATSESLTHPEIAIPLSYRNRLENTYNMTLGFAYVYMDGANTWDDLTSAFGIYPASELSSVSEDSITMMAQIKGSGTLTFDKKSVVLIGGDNDNAGLTFTNSQLNLDSWGRLQTVIYGTYTDSDFVTDASYTYLDTLTASNVNLCGGGYMDNYDSYDGLGFRCANSHQSRYFDETDHAYNSDWWGVHEYHEIATNVFNETSHFENCTFHNNGKTSYDILTGLGYVDDCYNNTWIVFDMKNVVSDRTNKRPIHKYACIVPENMCGLTMNYSYHGDNTFTIISENGTVISGANVTLSNTYNTYSNTTDANGKVIHDIDFYRIYFDYDNPPNCASTLEMGTYNLTITATDYADYSATVTISDPKDWTIALESRDWNYSQSLAWKILNLTDTTILKLSDGGNLAIAGNLYENTNTAPPNVIYKIANVLWLTQKGDLYLVKELMELI